MSFLRSLTLLFFSCACGLFGTARAAGSSADDVIIVTATRTAEQLDAVLPSSFVIGRNELSQSLASDITDLLRFHPGIDVARPGGPGQPVSIFIRGTESNHTLVLIDGVRFNPGTIGSAALQNIPPELVERVEVVKGPRSSIYGSDAIGGVINVITRDRLPGAHLEAQYGRGAYASSQASALGSYSGEQTSLVAGINWLESDGFPSRTTDDTDRGFSNVSGQLQGRLRLDGVTIGLRHWQAAGTSEYSDFFLTPVDQDFRNAVSALDIELSPAATWQTRLTASRMEDRIEQNQSADRLETERYGLDWQNDVTVGSLHRVTAGVMLRREDARSVSFGLGFDSEIDVRDVYLQDALDFGRHSILLATGLTDHETFGSHATWNAEYGIALGAATELTASAGTAFRAPDATDLYGFGGNPALEPERSLSYEVGLRHSVGGNHVFGLAAFENDIRDLIEFVVFDPTTFEGELRNVDEARIRGIEASYEYRGRNLTLRAEASWQDPENRTTGAQLLRRTRESATLALARRFGPVELIADVLYAGPREDFGVPVPVQLSSYVLANIAAQYRLGNGWSILARVENAFDEDYELASGYNTPDRSAYFALRYAPGH